MGKDAPKQPDRATVTLGDMYKPAKAALKAGVARNMSALVRDALAVYLTGGDKRPQLDTRPIVDSLAKLRVGLAPVGSNLNQLAHGFNSQGQIAFNRDALAESHAELREQFRAVMSALVELERGLRRPTR